MNSSTILHTSELPWLPIMTSSSTLVYFLTHGSYLRDSCKWNITSILFGGMFMGFGHMILLFLKDFPLVMDRILGYQRR